MEKKFWIHPEDNMGRSEVTTNTDLPTPHIFLATPDICCL